MDALSKVAKDEVLKVLRQKLSHHDAHIVGNAATALGSLKDSESVPQLKKLVQNKSLYRYARVMPMIALLEIQGTKDAEFVLGYLKDSDPYLRYSIIENISPYQETYIQDRLKEHIAQEKQLFVLQKLQEIFPEEFASKPTLKKNMAKGIEEGLELSIEGPRLVFFRRSTTFTVKIKNHTKQDFLDYSLKFDLPRGFDFISAELQGYNKQKKLDYFQEIVFHNDPEKDKDAIKTLLLDHSNTKPEILPQEKKFTIWTSTILTWNLDKIPAGKEISIDISVLGRGKNDSSVKAVLQGKLHHIKKQMNSTVLLCMPVPHISTYDTEDPLKVGDNTIYVVEIRNEGTSAITNVKLLNIIPKQMKLVNAQGPTSWKWLEKQHSVIFDSVLSIAPGEKRTYKIVCQAVEEGSARNKAAMLYDQFDQPIIDEEGTSTYIP
jgi:uncharacterized repeat protein (TIGR01451 family)